MKAGIKFKDKGVRKRFKHIQEWVKNYVPDYMEKLGHRIRSSIKDRVQSEGKGLKKKLKKYSPGYKAWKRRKGRQTSFRDLTFSGRMFNSLSLVKISNGIKIFFKGREEQIKAQANQKISAFFGIGKTEKRIVKSAIKELMKRAL